MTMTREPGAQQGAMPTGKPRSDIRMAIRFLAPGSGPGGTSTDSEQATSSSSAGIHTSHRQQARIDIGNVRASYTPATSVSPISESDGDSCELCTTRSPSLELQLSQDVRRVRDPRPTYNEEQRFFIAFLKIELNKCWRDTHDDFIRMFKVHRSIDGLTSVYYRIRREW